MPKDKATAPAYQSKLVEALLDISTLVTRIERYGAPEGEALDDKSYEELLQKILIVIPYLEEQLLWRYGDKVAPYVNLLRAYRFRPKLEFASRYPHEVRAYFSKGGSTKIISFPSYEAFEKGRQKWEFDGWVLRNVDIRVRLKDLHALAVFLIMVARDLQILGFNVNPRPITDIQKDLRMDPKVREDILRMIGVGGK